MPVFFSRSFSKICQSTIYQAPRTIKQIANEKNFSKFSSLLLAKQSKKTGEITDIETLTISCIKEVEKLGFFMALQNEIEESKT